MRKVSFDFDDTLEFESIQIYAESLLDHEDIELHITTSRYEDLKDYLPIVHKGGHDYLFEVAKKLDIPKENIHFTNFKDKVVFFEGKDFIWHLDDSYTECTQINRNTNTKAINSLASNWMYECNKALNLTNNKKD